MKRLLIVDTDPATRDMLAFILGSDPELEIIGCAASAEQALRMTAQDQPDVIALALHLPGNDGIALTGAIMQQHPTPIVVVLGGDGHDEKDIGMQAIEAGALVLVRRPFEQAGQAYHETANALIRAVKSMSEVRVVRRWNRNVTWAGSVAKQVRATELPAGPVLVAIGTSTGGPAAVRDILEQLPPDYALPVVVVQHMAKGFVEGYAQWLASVTHFPVSIARDGEQLVGGRAYLAPDGFQIGITHDLQVCLADAPPEHGMCPSVSYLFRSLARELASRTAAVLLTGMGRDGAAELKVLRDRGAITIVQDKATSAVHGMPGEAIRLDAAMMIMSSREIGRALLALDGTQRNDKGAASAAYGETDG